MWGTNMRIINGVKTIMDLFKDLRSMNRDEKADFYDSKCEYYQGIIELSLIVALSATIVFIYSDYMINGSIMPTLIPRLSVLLFLAVYFIVTQFRVSNRVYVVLDFFLGHGMVIAASWTAYHLVDRSHSVEGIILVNLIWLMVGFVGTPKDSAINGVVFIIELIITNTFNQYANFDVILALEIPCLIGITLVHYIMTAYYLDHYRVTQKLELAMVTDPLTQVYNRHLLEKIISQNTIKDVTKGEHIAVALIDIDDFKKINDDNGHYTGDLTLLYMGQKLSKETHENDYVIRYGGEEFVVILRNCDVNNACARMEQFRQDIETAKDTPVPFTISVGVSCYTGDYSKTLQNVDAALYKAKNSGKNKVIVM